MAGETLDIKNHFCLKLGQYCKVHEEEIQCNNKSPITKGAIYLGTIGNIQGVYNIMALNSGRKIVWRNWDLIPMPDTLIACVNTLGRYQPKILTLADRHGRLIGDTETPVVGANSDEDEVEFPGVDAEL